MKKTLLTVLVILAACFAFHCGGGSDQIQVVFNDVPYPTEKNLRIGYTLSTWEYEKDGLELQKIIVQDDSTKAELFVIGKDDIAAGEPKLLKDPLPPLQFVTWDKLTRYYISIQLPIPLGNTPPKSVTHRFVFTDKATQKEVTVEGGTLRPLLGEAPVLISSPIKGKNLLFWNQSTMGYHFYVIFFMNGGMARPERYATDTMQFNDANTGVYDGDPAVNESYFNYGSTLYAVADGTVLHITDGLPENHGDLKDVKFNSLIEYAGNYLVLDMGGGRYAYYCHAIPGSFKVAKGDFVKEGQPLAQLGNSGNSTSPHLHFQICDGPDFFSCIGMPFIFRNYTATADITDLDHPVFLTPTPVTDAMMEQFTVVRVE